jgi:hypothetical protein
MAAQDIDAIITSENRKAATIADEIHDPAERAAFLALFAKNTPEKGLALTRFSSTLSPICIPRHGL